jgi:hypothetical protein
MALELPKLTSGQLADINAATGIVAGIGQSFAQEAQGIYQQTAYQLNALNTLTVSNIRADQDERYAAIQAGRVLKRAEIDGLNYTIAGNTILRNMEKANASARARAAANGIAFGEGSAAGVQAANVQAAYRDVGIADFNALMARVLGFEDATAMLTNAEIQAQITRVSASMQAGQYEQAAKAASATSGLLSGATLAQTALKASQTLKVT